MTNIWVVRAGDQAVYAEDFLNREMVAIGWDLGPSMVAATKAELERRYRVSIPGARDAQVRNAVGQIDAFLHKMEPGQPVLTYDRSRRLYFLGQIDGPPAYRPELPPDLRLVRPVRWTQKVHRDSLTVEARNTLGAIQTVFQVKGSAADEVMARALPLDEREPAAAAVDEPVSTQEAVRSLAPWQGELLEKANEAIEDRIVRLSWAQMQELIAGILRAMGYKTNISPSGPDRGVDIFASPDGLGLQEPRIFVEVKHRPRQSMGAQDIRSFLGGRAEGDRCLYVSTGGFSKDAQYEADRSKIAIRLLTLVEVRRLLVDHYEELDEEIRALVPLRHVYVLAA